MMSARAWARPVRPARSAGPGWARAALSQPDSESESVTHWQAQARRLALRLPVRPGRRIRRRACGGSEPPVTVELGPEPFKLNFTGTQAVKST